MKKIILITLLLCGISTLATSCTTETLHFKNVPENVTVLKKYTTIESTHDWVLDIYKTYTAYHLVLDNGTTIEVSADTYNKYDVEETKE